MSRQQSRFVPTQGFSKVLAWSAGGAYIPVSSKWADKDVTVILVGRLRRSFTAKATPKGKTSAYVLLPDKANVAEWLDKTVLVNLLSPGELL